MKIENFTTTEKWTITQLIDSLQESPITKNKVVIPQYQRKLVWSQKQKKEFIDSIKRGFPGGSLLLFRSGSEGDVTRYSLVDGLQRTTTIKDYIDNPTKFIEKEDIDDNIIDEALEIICFNEEYKDKIKNIKEEYKDKIKNILVSWLKNLKGFKESDGYSSATMAEHIIKKLKEDEPNLEVLEKRLRNILIPLKEKIENESDILSVEIPVIIYFGDENNLPIIFERINSKGTKLSKYEIFAATWFNDTLEISNTEIIDFIKEKYDSLIEEGLEVDNYDPTQEDFYQNNFTVFEYMFGLGKYLAEKYPYLFGSSKENDSIDSIAFNLYTICLIGDLNKMSQLPTALENIEVEKFLEVILDCIEIVFQALRPYITMKANKKNSKNKSNIVIYHTEYQIISFIAKIYFMKYDDSLNERTTWKSNKELIIKNIPQHYLADIIKEYWRGTGDSKLKELIKEDSRYEKVMYKENWENILKEWLSQQLDRQEITRVNLRDTDILFLKYIYAHIMTTYQELSSQEFEIDHIVPIEQLKKLVNNKGIPMSSVGNLCIIEKSLNRSKSGLNIYQYYDKQINDNKLSQEQAKVELKKVEKFTFTNRKLLEYDDLTIEKYIEILEQRYTILLNKFYETNNIESKPQEEE